MHNWSYSSLLLLFCVVELNYAIMPTYFLYQHFITSVYTYYCSGFYFPSIYTF